MSPTPVENTTVETSRHITQNIVCHINGNTVSNIYHTTVAFDIYQKHGADEGLRYISDAISQIAHYCNSFNERRMQYERWSGIKYEFQKLIKDEETNSNPQTS